MISVSLDPSGETASIRLAAFLGSDRFATYRRVCSENGAAWISSAKANRIPVGALPGFLAALAASGLAYGCDPEIAKRLAEEAARTGADLAAGRARLVAARERLAASGKSLFRYQETGIEWIAPRRVALLADDMGLGKTAQALVALPENAAALVIAPAAVRFGWTTEIRAWRPDLRPVVVDASSFRWPRAGEVVVATYGSLPESEVERRERAKGIAEDAAAAEEGSAEETPTALFEDFSTRRRGRASIAEHGLPVDPVVVIADEAHLVKNARASRTRRVREIARTAIDGGGRLWMLTGTPLLNRARELWNILETGALGKAAFGSYPSFVRTIESRDEAAVATALRKVALRRRKAEVLVDLPSKTRQDVGVLLDARTAALCDDLVEALRSKGKTVDDLLGGVQDPIVFEKISRVRAAVAAAKIPTLLEIVEEYEEAEEPLVVFSCHRAPIDVLGARAGWATITGETSADDRGRIVAEFQAGKLRGIAGTVRAMGVGVTLTRASNLLLVDLDWTPALNLQAEDRVLRIGQRNAVLVKRLVAAHAIDERVVELLTSKQALIERTVEASSVEADHVAASPAEALAAAAAEAARVQREAEERGIALAEKARAEKEAERRAAVARLADVSDGRKISVDGRFRSAANAVEDWAAEGIVLLAGLDPDRAREVNGAGFSKFDGEFGHSLASRVQRDGMLSDAQWAAAVRLARRYRRQLPPEPGASPAEATAEVAKEAGA